MLAPTNTARTRWNEFFHATETPYSLALIRIALPLVMLSMIVPRWRFTRELYSADGATAPLALGYGYAHFLPEFSGTVAVALCTLLLFCMATSIVGWCTRVSLGITCVLFTYLAMTDAISTMTKYSVISTHLLLLLALSDCGAVWSVDAWLARRRSGPATTTPKVPVWPRRLIQYLIGIIYFGAAMTKLNTPAFLSGDQTLFWMLTHINFRHPIGEWFSLYPVLIKIGSYCVLVFEVTFVFLVWGRKARPWVLAFGIFFHIMTVLTLGLLIFPLVCFCCYLAFAEEDDITPLIASAERLRQRWPSLLTRGAMLAALGKHADGLRPSKTCLPKAASMAPILSQLFEPAGRLGWIQPLAPQLAFVVAALLVTVAGVKVEYALDLYGDRRPEGPYQLQPVSDELARRLLSPPQPIRDVDKFFSIDTGTILSGDMLIDRRRVFRHGERLIAQCNLTPPHEDMWVECKIRDSDNQLVDRLGNVVLREQFRATFEYPISGAIEPGNYSLVFENAGREVIRKRFEVVGNGVGASAN